MKKIYTLITILIAFNGMLFSQKKMPIFTYNSLRKIELNHRFIAMDENLEHLPFSTIAIDSLSMDSINYVIHVGRFQDWENEPGDFDIIQFYQNGKTILTYKDASGIVKLNQRKNHYAYHLKLQYHCCF